MNSEVVKYCPHCGRAYDVPARHACRQCGAELRARFWVLTSVVGNGRWDNSQHCATLGEAEKRIAEESARYCARGEHMAVKVIEGVRREVAITPAIGVTVEILR